MTRSPAQNQAAERDGLFCMWGRHGAADPFLAQATDVHHLARRQPGGDVPECCIHLSHEVHMRHHQGFEPTTSQLLDLMLKVYGLDLRQKYPIFFGNY